MNTKNTARDLALVAVFAALIAVFTLIPGIPVGAVPITLQTLAISLAALVLGPVLGAAAVVLWLCVGWAGLPVFTGYKSTFAVMKGPTAGYLIGFVIGAFLLGIVARVILRRYRTRSVTIAALAIAAFLASVLVYYPCGIVGLMNNMKMPLDKAVKLNLAFLPGDAIKAVIAGFVADAVNRAFPALMLGTSVADLDD